MGLIKLTNDEPKEAEEDNVQIMHRVDVREPMINDNARIVSRILSILENLNVDYIRIEKGKINYVHYPSYKSEE